MLKKGQKKINKAPIEAVESDSTTAEVFNTLDETASRSEQWIEKNQKPLFSALLVVVVLILGYLAYTTYVQAPKELEAANELAFPKEYFENKTLKWLDPGSGHGNYSLCLFYILFKSLIKSITDFEYNVKFNPNFNPSKILGFKTKNRYNYLSVKYKTAQYCIYSFGKLVG